MKKDYAAPLLPGCLYHVFNRAVGNEKLFLCEENYRFFLEKFFYHTQSFSEIYCYTLLPNHFHFLLKIKPEERLSHLKEDQRENVPGYVSKQFSNLFNTYTKSFNGLYGRKGGLFMTPFKRIIVKKDTYFSKLVHYVHANPVHHGICQSVYEWKHSSIHNLTNSAPTVLLRNDTISFFGGLNQFIQFHEQPIIPKLNIDYE